MMKNLSFPAVLFLFMSAILFTQCTPQRKLIYLQGETGILASDTTQFRMKLYPGDIISVNLFTVNPDAFPGMGAGADKSGVMDNRSAYEKGFVLDDSGKVSLPYVGLVHLGGMTISQATETVTDKFRMYIDEPVIILKKLSFKVSVIGEVNRPGLYYVPNEQLTILEALAMAGDLNNYADRTSLRILRKTDNGTLEIPVDLTSKEAYVGIRKFIHPDDVLYVAPSRKKAFTTLSPATTILTSLISTIVVLATLYIRTND